MTALNLRRKIWKTTPDLFQQQPIPCEEFPALDYKQWAIDTNQLWLVKAIEEAEEHSAALKVKMKESYFVKYDNIPEQYVSTYLCHW